MLQVGDILSQMDGFLLPSRADTVPIAIIEAMRAGLPVFASGVGEIPNMIEKCGIVIEPTVESVKQLLCEVANGQVNMEMLGDAARKKFLDSFQISSMINQYSEVINEL